MIRRIDCGTDVAMIGAWDAGRSTLSKEEWRRLDLREEAASGDLFLITTGGDGGYAVDILLGEEPSPLVRRNTITVSREFLLRVPSGRLLVGGAEDYLNPQPQITSQAHEIEVPPGDYLLCCRVGTLSEDDYPGDEDFTKFVSDEDYSYHRSKAGGGACLIGCLLLLGAVGALLLRVKWLAATALVGLLVCAWIERRRYRRNVADERLQRVNKAIQEFEAQFPDLVIELRPLPPGHAATGGSLDLTEVYGGKFSSPPTQDWGENQRAERGT